MARAPEAAKSGRRKALKTGDAESGTRPFDLKRAVDCWMEGDWPLLAVKDAGLIAPDRDRGLTAAYVACACQFCDDHDGARVWARRALDWGCPLSYLSRVLIAGAQITLARMAAVAGDAARARAHMAQSAEPVAGAQSQAHAEARLSKDLAGLGLLEAAALVIAEDLDRLNEQPLAPVSRHRIAIVKSELKILRHQLALHKMQARTEEPQALSGSTDAEAARKRSTSQLGQDLWVLERTGYKRNGYFVEFGATDGVLLSNTFLLEKMFGWSGLLAEPNPDYFADLRNNRSSAAFDACIAGKSGETVDFVLADEFGGIRDYIGRDRHASRRASYAEIPEHVLTLTTISLDEFLAENGAPKRIDYISVDTEGSELDILRAFPFDKWDVSLWTVEHNFTEDREKIHEIMTSNGYLRKEADFDDWYYKADGQG